MFDRVGEIILQRNYQAKTKELRIEFEEESKKLETVKGLFSDLSDRNAKLADDNHSLEIESERLRSEISLRNGEVARSTTELDDLHKKKQKLYHELERIGEEIADTNREKSRLDAEISLATEKLSELSGKISEYKKLFTDLDAKLSNYSLRADDKMDELAVISEELSNDQEKLSQDIIFNTKEKEEIDQTKARLNLYVERMNKHYEDEGMGIRLKKFGE